VDGQGFDKEPLSFCLRSPTGRAVCEGYAEQFITHAGPPEAGPDFAIETVSYSQEWGTFSDTWWNYDDDSHVIKIGNLI
jgi:hypothetical protein